MCRKSKIRAFAVLFLAAVMLFSVCIQAKAEKTKQPLSIAVGEGEDEAGYGQYSSGTEGPQDFLVDGDAVYLLDSEHHRIMVFCSGKWERNIALDFYPTKMELMDGALYVYFPNVSKVYCYAPDGTLNGTYRAVDIELNGAVKKEIKQSFCAYKDCEIEENETVLNEQYSKITYYNSETNRFIGEMCLVKRNGKGERIGATVLDFKDWETQPKNYLRAAGDKLYVMKCYADHIVIEEAVFTESMETVSELLFGRMQAEKNAVQAQQAAVSGKETISLSRSDVIGRANAMSNTAWHVREGHLQVRLVNVIVPDVVKNNMFIVGIPYCWGGFFGLDDNSENGTKVYEYAYGFMDQIYASDDNGKMVYTAGNVCGKAPGYVPGTIGLDCSGFVSSAYGLSIKKNTSGLAGAYRPVSQTELQWGDILVTTGSGAHVMIYIGMKDNDTVSVYDCNSTQDTGKVMRREVPKTELCAEGYKAYSPWVE